MIEVRNVTKTFDKRLLFDKISVNFEPGKVYALVGASGSGKTTLLNIIAHLERYDSGQVLYYGQDLKKIKATTFFRENLGYLFQNFALLESQTIQENLDLGLVGQKLAKKEKEKRQLAALERVGLSYLNLKQKIYELSGGEAQRVALAKVILKDPPLILADEPTAALDPATSREIMDMLLSLKSDHRIIIIATHNPMIWELADEIVEVQNLG